MLMLILGMFSRADINLSTWNQDIGSVSLPNTFSGQIIATELQTCRLIHFTPSNSGAFVVRFQLYRPRDQPFHCKCELSEGVFDCSFITNDDTIRRFDAGRKYTFSLQGSAGLTSGTGHMEGIADDLATGICRIVISIKPLPTLDTIAIEGPSILKGGQQANYNCLSILSDASSMTVPAESWKIIDGSSYASISASGVLKAALVTTSCSVTIEARYQGKTTTKNLTIDPLRPDLTPKTPSGWNAPLIVVPAPLGTVEPMDFCDADSFYVQYGISCIDEAVSGRFRNNIYLDGILVGSADTAYIGKDACLPSTMGISIGKLSVGQHNLKLVIDAGNTVAESDEGNNIFERTITVVKSVLVHYSPGTWGLESATTEVGAQGKHIILKDAMFTCSGYAQKGWSKDPEGETKDFDLNKSLQLTETTTLYPYWEPTDDFFISRNILFDYTGPGGVVRIPSGVTNISWWAGGSASWNEVTDLVFPSSLTSIEQGGIRDYAKLKSIVFRSSTLTLDRIFYECSSLMSLTFEGNIENLTFYDSFERCASLTSLTFKGNVENLTFGAGAFEGCSSLRSLNFLGSVGFLALDDSAFRDCIGLADDKGFVILWDVLIQYYGGTGTVEIPKNITRVGSHAFWDRWGIKSVIMPPDVKNIGIRAFDSCHNLEQVTMPGVTNIESSAFANCPMLKTVSIPSGVKVINANTFYRCSELTTALIAPGVETIRYNAFQDCSKLKEISIPPSVTTIENDAFRGCMSLDTIYVYEDDVARVMGLLQKIGISYEAVQCKILVNYVNGKPVPPNCHVIAYVPNGGIGMTKSVICPIGCVYHLDKFDFVPPVGMRFIGWQNADNGRLYDDGILVFNLTQIPNLKVRFLAVYEPTVK